MALVVKDRVKVTATTTGTGTFTLGAAVAGYQAFSVIGDGNTTYYAISGQGSTEWEVGLGTYATAGTTLARTVVLSSSNSNLAVNFSAGTKDVFCTYPAEKSVTSDSPTLVTPALGTPSSGTMTNVGGTAVSLTSGITNALKSATTTVSVSAATAPSVDQVLRATSSTTATWQTLAPGETVATSTIWDAKGDLVAGTGVDTAIRLAVGTNDQVLIAASGETSGLKWGTLSGTPTLVIVTATTATAVKDTHVVFNNAALTTITLPLSPAAGDLVWITSANALTTNVVARNGQTIMDLAEDLTLNVAMARVQLRFASTSWRLIS